MTHEDLLDSVPQVPVISDEDVEQEFQLLLLEYERNPLRGAEKPSRRVIRQRLESQNRESLIGEVPFYATSVGEDDELDRRLDATEQLLQWCDIQDNEELTQMVAEFLEDPSEHNLSVITNRLTKLGIIADPTAAKRQTTSGESLSALIIRQLQQRHTLSLESLYELARNAHTSSRPEAAVRQTLRRLERRGDIVRIDSGLMIVWQGEQNA